ncbi:MAG: hypothetical protein WCP97_03995 [bacterium]
MPFRQRKELGIPSDTCGQVETGRKPQRHSLIKRLKQMDVLAQLGRIPGVRDGIPVYQHIPIQARSQNPPSSRYEAAGNAGDPHHQHTAPDGRGRAEIRMAAGGDGGDRRIVTLSNVLSACLTATDVNEIVQALLKRAHWEREIIGYQPGIESFFNVQVTGKAGDLIKRLYNGRILPRASCYGTEGEALTPLQRAFGLLRDENPELLAECVEVERDGQHYVRFTSKVSEWLTFRGKEIVEAAHPQALDQSIYARLGAEGGKKTVVGNILNALGLSWRERKQNRITEIGVEVLEDLLGGRILYEWIGEKKKDLGFQQWFIATITEILNEKDSNNENPLETKRCIPYSDGTTLPKICAVGICGGKPLLITTGFRADKFIVARLEEEYKRWIREGRKAKEFARPYPCPQELLYEELGINGNDRTRADNIYFALEGKGRLRNAKNTSLLPGTTVYVFNDEGGVKVFNDLWNGMSVKDWMAKKSATDRAQLAKFMLEFLLAEEKDDLVAAICQTKVRAQDTRLLVAKKAELEIWPTDQLSRSVVTKLDVAYEAWERTERERKLNERDTFTALADIVAVVADRMDSDRRDTVQRYVYQAARHLLLWCQSTKFPEINDDRLVTTATAHPSGIASWEVSNTSLQFLLRMGIARSVPSLLTEEGIPKDSPTWVAIMHAAETMTQLQEEATLDGIQGMVESANKHLIVTKKGWQSLIRMFEVQIRSPEKAIGALYKELQSQCTNEARLQKTITDVTAVLLEWGCVQRTGDSNRWSQTWCSAAVYSIAQRAVLLRYHQRPPQNERNWATIQATEMRDESFATNLMYAIRCALFANHPRGIAEVVFDPEYGSFRLSPEGATALAAELSIDERRRVQLSFEEIMQILESSGIRIADVSRFSGYVGGQHPTFRGYNKKFDLSAFTEQDAATIASTIEAIKAGDHETTKNAVATLREDTKSKELSSLLPTTQDILSYLLVFFYCRGLTVSQKQEDGSWKELVAEVPAAAIESQSDPAALPAGPPHVVEAPAPKASPPPPPPPHLTVKEAPAPPADVSASPRTDGHRVEKRASEPPTYEQLVGTVPQELQFVLRYCRYRQAQGRDLPDTLPNIAGKLSTIEFAQCLNTILGAALAEIRVGELPPEFGKGLTELRNQGRYVGNLWLILEPHQLEALGKLWRNTTQRPSFIALLQRRVFGAQLFHPVSVGGVQYLNVQQPDPSGEYLSRISLQMRSITGQTGLSFRPYTNEISGLGRPSRSRAPDGILISEALLRQALTTDEITRVLLAVPEEFNPTQSGIGVGSLEEMRENQRRILLSDLAAKREQCGFLASIVTMSEHEDLYHEGAIRCYLATTRDGNFSREFISRYALPALRDPENPYHFLQPMIEKYGGTEDLLNNTEAFLQRVLEDELSRRRVTVDDAFRKGFRIQKLSERVLLALQDIAKKDGTTLTYLTEMNLQELATVDLGTDGVWIVTPCIIERENSTGKMAIVQRTLPITRVTVMSEPITYRVVVTKTGDEGDRSSSLQLTSEVNPELGIPVALPTRWLNGGYLIVEASVRGLPLIDQARVLLAGKNWDGGDVSSSRPDDGNSSPPTGSGGERRSSGGENGTQRGKTSAFGSGLAAQMRQSDQALKAASDRYAASTRKKAAAAIEQHAGARPIRRVLDAQSQQIGDELLAASDKIKVALEREGQRITAQLLNLGDPREEMVRIQRFTREELAQAESAVQQAEAQLSVATGEERAALEEQIAAIRRKIAQEMSKF